LRSLLQVVSIELQKSRHSDARADEPIQGEWPARALRILPRWPLASLRFALLRRAPE